MKYFIVADVHSYYDEMIKALNEAGFDRDNPEHTFVSLGDLLDRSTQPQECLDFVNSLDPDRCILIRGNHEDLMEECIYYRFANKYDKQNGTVDTAKILTGIDAVGPAFTAMRMNQSYRSYDARLRDFYETKTAIFVHGWIPCWQNKKMDGTVTFIEYEDDWRNAPKALWKEARWVNGMNVWNYGIRDSKTIYCGHWHSAWGNCYLHGDGNEFPDFPIKGRAVNYNPFIDNGIVALDACTVTSGIVNCVVLEEK